MNLSVCVRERERACSLFLFKGKIMYTCFSQDKELKEDRREDIQLDKQADKQKEGYLDETGLSGSFTLRKHRATEGRAFRRSLKVRDRRHPPWGALQGPSLMTTRDALPPSGCPPARGTTSSSCPTGAGQDLQGSGVRCHTLGLAHPAAPS